MNGRLLGRKLSRHYRRRRKGTRHDLRRYQETRFSYGEKLLGNGDRDSL